MGGIGRDSLLEISCTLGPAATAILLSHGPAWVHEHSLDNASAARLGNSGWFSRDSRPGNGRWPAWSGGEITRTLQRSPTSSHASS